MRRGLKLSKRPALPAKLASGALGFLLAILCLTGCSDKDKIPSGILPPDKMQRVLWDMIQADQYAGMYLTKDSVGLKSKEQTLTLYAQVFQLHKISREDFEKSFQYYIDRPDLSRSLLDSVLKLGNRDRTTITVMAPKITPATGASPPPPFHQFVKPGGRVPPGTPGHLLNSLPRGGAPGPPAHLPNALPRGVPSGSLMQHPPPASPAQRLHPPVTHPSADSSARKSHIPRRRHSADSSGHLLHRPYHISR